MFTVNKRDSQSVKRAEEIVLIAGYLEYSFVT